MLYYSYKDLIKRYEKAHTQAEKNALKRERDILHIATHGGNKKGVYEATFKKAKKAYNLFKRLNRYNDYLLEADNDERRYNTRYTAIMHEEADNIEKKTKEALKGLKLQLVYYSAFASICDEQGRTIGLNYVI